MMQFMTVVYCFLCLCRVVYKLLASKSESIRVQALKVLGYFLKHLAHKYVGQVEFFYASADGVAG